MRTKTLKIGSEKVECLLIGGGPGFKVYSTLGFEGWLLNIGRLVHKIPESDWSHKIVSKFVNIKYMPIGEQSEIKRNIVKLVETLGVMK